jgi:hypothetical protein
VNRATNPTDQAWLDAAAATPLERVNNCNLLIGRFDSPAALWSACPSALIRDNGHTTTLAADNPSVLAPYGTDADKARAMLAAGVPLQEHRERIAKLLERADVGAVESECAAFSCRPAYAYFADADEAVADRVTEGAEVWQAGIRRGRIAPTVRIGYNTLAKFGFQGHSNYIAFAAVAHVVCSAAAALGWQIELTYVNVGIEQGIRNGRDGVLGIACRVADPSRPFDPDVIAAHAGSAGHQWATWAFNCSACDAYRNSGYAFTSSRHSIYTNSEELKAVQKFLGLDYLVNTCDTSATLEQISAGILKAGMTAAMADAAARQDR